MTNSVERVVWHMFFFHFVSQDELIVSKVIFLPYSKLIVRVSYFFAFLEKFWKMEQVDNITERCQRYKMNK